MSSASGDSLRPQTLTGVLSLDPDGGLLSFRPPHCPRLEKKSCGRPWLCLAGAQVTNQRRRANVLMKCVRACACAEPATGGNKCSARSWRYVNDDDDDDDQQQQQQQQQQELADAISKIQQKLMLRQ